MPKLTIEETGRSVVYEILDDVVLVGRREGAAVRLTDPHVGMEHCQIRLTPGVGYKLVDLESRNGTKVNGSFVNQHVLRDGDVIEVGKAKLRFSGGTAPVPAAAAPSAAPVPAPAPAPVGAPPVPPAAAPGPARPRPAPSDREPRVRRSRRRKNDTPIILAAVIPGALLLLVAFIWLGNAWFRLPYNTKIYHDMTDLMREGKYEAALKLAETADPNQDPEGWRKVQSEKKNVEEFIAARGGLAASQEAFQEYSAIESWIQDHRDDVRGAIERWQAFARKWDGKSDWAGAARKNARKLLGGAEPMPVPGGNTPEPRPDSLEHEWNITQGVVRNLREKDRFQDAIDAALKFWDDNQLKTGAQLDRWKSRVDASVRESRDAAAARWDDLSLRAKQLARDGNVEGAVDIMRDVARKFGIEKYQSMAAEKMREYLRDG
jgi:hypothetical protein